MSDDCRDCWQHRNALAEVNAEVERLRDERDSYREALRSILLHGTTTEPPHDCWAIHPGDCADVFREVARAALEARKP